MQGCRKGDQCPFAHMATDQSREEIQAEIERITHKGRPGHPHAEAEHQSHAHAHVHAQGDHSQHPYHHLGFGKQQKHGTAKGGLPFRQKGLLSSICLKSVIKQPVQFLTLMLAWQALLRIYGTGDIDGYQ